MATASPVQRSISSIDFVVPAEDAWSSDGRRSSMASLRRLNLHDRANSDTNLAHSSLLNCSSLSVDKQQCSLGCDDCVTVSWHITEEVGATDWIGLFLVGE